MVTVSAPSASRRSTSRRRGSSCTSSIPSGRSPRELTQSPAAVAVTAATSCSPVKVARGSTAATTVRFARIDVGESFAQTTTGHSNACRASACAETTATSASSVSGPAAPEKTISNGGSWVRQARIPSRKISSSSTTATRRIGSWRGTGSARRRRGRRGVARPFQRCDPGADETCAQLLARRLRHRHVGEAAVLELEEHASGARHEPHAAPCRHVEAGQAEREPELVRALPLDSPDDELVAVLDLEGAAVDEARVADRQPARVREQTPRPGERRRELDRAVDVLAPPVARPLAGREEAGQPREEVGPPRRERERRLARALRLVIPNRDERLELVE